MAEIEVQQADITKLEVDAIANAANTGAAARRRGRGGDRAGRRAGRFRTRATSWRRSALGEAVATSAGEMPCELGDPRRDHAPRRTDLGRDHPCRHREHARQGRRARRQVAGAGRLRHRRRRLPVDEAARIEVEEVAGTWKAGSGLERVVFAVFGADASGPSTPLAGRGWLRPIRATRWEDQRAIRRTWRAKFSAWIRRSAWGRVRARVAVQASRRWDPGGRSLASSPDWLRASSSTPSAATYVRPLPAAGPGLGGDDHVDPAALGVAAGRRERLRAGDRDLHRLAAARQTRAPAVAVAARGTRSCAAKQVGAGRDPRRRRAADRLLGELSSAPAGTNRSGMRLTSSSRSASAGRSGRRARDGLARDDRGAKRTELALEVGAIPAGDAAASPAHASAAHAEPDRAGAAAHAARPALARSRGCGPA